MPLCLFAILRALNRSKILYTEETTRRFGALTVGYESEQYFFEIVWMSRTALCGLICMVPGFTQKVGTNSQPTFGLIIASICLKYILIEFVARPYQARDYFILWRLESAMAWAVVCTIFMSCWLDTSDTTVLFHNTSDTIAGNIRDIVVSMITLTVHLRFLFFVALSFKGDFEHLRMQILGQDQSGAHESVKLKANGFRMEKLSPKGVRLFCACIRELAEADMRHYGSFNFHRLQMMLLRSFADAYYWRSMRFAHGNKYMHEHHERKFAEAKDHEHHDYEHMMMQDLTLSKTVSNLSDIRMDSNTSALSTTASDVRPSRTLSVATNHAMDTRPWCLKDHNCGNSQFSTMSAIDRADIFPALFAEGADLPEDALKAIQGESISINDLYKGVMNTTHLLLRTSKDGIEDTSKQLVRGSLIARTNSISSDETGEPLKLPAWGSATRGPYSADNAKYRSVTNHKRFIPATRLVNYLIAKNGPEDFTRGRPLTCLLGDPHPGMDKELVVICYQSRGEPCKVLHFLEKIEDIEEGHVVHNIKTQGFHHVKTEDLLAQHSKPASAAAAADADADADESNAQKAEREELELIAKYKELVQAIAKKREEEISLRSRLGLDPKGDVTSRFGLEPDDSEPEEYLSPNKPRFSGFTTPGWLLDQVDQAGQNRERVMSQRLGTTSSPHDVHILPQTLGRQAVAPASPTRDYDGTRVNEMGAEGAEQYAMQKEAEELAAQLRKYQKEARRLQEEINAHP
jgi:hypothetical protein